MKTGDNGLNLEMWPTDKVKPYEKNPRSIPDKAVQKVAASLKEFGFQKPIVVDADGVILAGHVMLSQHIIWAKDRFTLGRSHYQYQHEPCWYAVKGKGHWCGARDQTSVWTIKAREDGGHGHGTQKPIECMRRPIMNNSSPGQAVYEPFSGSGTTIIACEMTGRHCHAIELNPAYVDVAILRWQQFTGGVAVNEADGRSFLEYAAERRPLNPIGTSQFKSDKKAKSDDKAA